MVLISSSMVWWNVQFKWLRAHFSPIRSSWKVITTAQKIKLLIMDFFSKYDQIHSFLAIWSNFLKKFLMKIFIFLCSILSYLLESNSITRRGVSFWLSRKIFQCKCDHAWVSSYNSMWILVNLLWKVFCLSIGCH